VIVLLAAGCSSAAATSKRTAQTCDEPTPLQRFASSTRANPWAFQKDAPTRSNACDMSEGWLRCARDAGERWLDVASLARLMAQRFNEALIDVWHPRQQWHVFGLAPAQTHSRWNSVVRHLNTRFVDQ
jgi:hypothetical protein